MSNPSTESHVSTGGRRALVVRGGWDGHHPVEATDLFLPYLKENGFDVVLSDTPESYADPETADVDLIVQCYTMGTISRDAVRGLRAAVAGGTGLVGWHGGIADSFRDAADYLQLIGGQFACHPSRHPDQRSGDQADNYLPYAVTITAPEHPVVAGLADFDLTTEQYWVLTDEYNDVLATTTHPAPPWHPWHRPVTVPAVWTRAWGRGRVVVVTPGHSLDVLENPSVRTIVERSLLWASR
ncbi:ThuA domain-containing protein [Actinoplanes sp. NPDC051851]|uniref:ThuA domain-containing protein n=1 Tax=Actinoplanes sp. NPDC051851 TaxID=3154753 RepID=UPI00342ACBF0